MASIAYDPSHTYTASKHVYAMQISSLLATQNKEGSSIDRVWDGARAIWANANVFEVCFAVVL